MRPSARTRRRPSAGSSSTRRRSRTHSRRRASGDCRERARSAAEACSRRPSSASTAGAKVGIITDIDTGTSIAIQKKFTAVGGKTIDYDRQIIGGTGSVYISFDNPSVGRQQALGVLAGMKKNGTYNANGTVAQLWGGPTDANAFAFKSGNDAVLNPLFKAKKIKRGPAKFVPLWDRRQGTDDLRADARPDEQQHPGRRRGERRHRGRRRRDAEGEGPQADPALRVRTRRSRACRTSSRAGRR